MGSNLLGGLRTWQDGHTLRIRLFCTIIWVSRATWKPFFAFIMIFCLTMVIAIVICALIIHPFAIQPTYDLRRIAAYLINVFAASSLSINTNWSIIDAIIPFFANLSTGGLCISCACTRGDTLVWWRKPEAFLFVGFIVFGTIFLVSIVRAIRALVLAACCIRGTKYCGARVSIYWCTRFGYTAWSIPHAILAIKG